MTSDGFSIIADRSGGLRNQWQRRLKSVPDGRVAHFSFDVESSMAPSLTSSLAHTAPVC